MIGKLIKGSGAKGLFAYLLGTHDMNGDKRPRVELIGGSFAGSNVSELSAEFGQLRALKPRLSRAVAHQCLRLPDGDSVPSDVTWSQIADRWTKEMGFEMYAVVSHGDHIHIAASRINLDGSVVTDSHDWRRSEAAIRQIEIEFGLTQIESSHLLEPEKATTHHKAPTRGQIAMVERGIIPPSAILAELIDTKIKDGCTASELVYHLEENGVSVRPNIASTGKVSGMSYELDGIEITAKAMGRGFTWTSLQKRGMNYEQDRDLQRIREAGYRAASATDAGSSLGDGERNTANRPPKPILAGPSGGYSETHLASGSVPRLNGQDDKRELEPFADSPNTSRTSESGHRKHSSDAGISVDQAGRNSHKSAQPVSSKEPKRPLENSPDVRSRSIDIKPGSDLERLVVLAITASKNRPEGSGHNAQNGRTDKGLAQLKLRATEVVNRTKQAVSDYLQALPATSYRLQLVRPDQPNVNLPGQTPEQVMKSVPWLKSENARGADIYIRPEDRRYILLDDVTPSTIEKLKADGLAPCAILETSKGNYAAWVKVAPESTPEPAPEAATTIAKALARTYNADPAAADYAHVSRLPGFTNRKPSRIVDGKSPFVLLTETTGRVAKTGLDLIDQVRVYLEKTARRAAILATDRVAPTTTKEGDPVTAYRAAMRRHSSDQSIDQSQADFRAAQDMVLTGWSIKQIQTSIEEASPSVIQRKGQATAGYASRTAANALSSDKVQAELQRRAKDEEIRQRQQKQQQEREAREAARRAPRPRF